jgi:hypothetical protein
MHVNMHCQAVNGAYDTCKCHEAITARDAQAVILPRLRPSGAELIHWINSKTPQTRVKMQSPGSPLPCMLACTAWQWTSAEAIARKDAVNAQGYPGRTLWRRWSGYHRRSRVETKMYCMKPPGQLLMARDFDRQVAEIQIRITVLNRYTALGIPVTEPVG